MEEAKRSYRNICLSYRGAERQPPNSLHLAFRFSAIVEIKMKDGTHAFTIGGGRAAQYRRFGSQELH